MASYWDGSAGNVVPAATGSGASRSGRSPGCRAAKARGSKLEEVGRPRFCPESEHRRPVVPATDLGEPSEACSGVGDHRLREEPRIPARGHRASRGCAVAIPDALPERGATSTTRDRLKRLAVARRDIAHVRVRQRAHLGCSCEVVVRRRSNLFDAERERAERSEAGPLPVGSTSRCLGLERRQWRRTSRVHDMNESDSRAAHVDRYTLRWLEEIMLPPRPARRPVSSAGVTAYQTVCELDQQIGGSRNSATLPRVGTCRCREMS